MNLTACPRLNLITLSQPPKRIRKSQTTTAPSFRSQIEAEKLNNHNTNLHIPKQETHNLDTNEKAESKKPITWLPTHQEKEPSKAWTDVRET
jgi:hypothetical protein